MAEVDRYCEQTEIEELIRRALTEDIRSGDITSNACIGPEEMIAGRLLLRQAGRIAGIPFFEMAFKEVDPEIDVRFFVEEGSDLEAGSCLGTVTGPARGVFSAERVALNFLQHTSGVATITSKYVERVEDFPCDILDTRKTVPGLRPLQRYAVRIGGGTNHRSGLDDRFIIKNNHLAFLARETRHPILEAVRRARSYRPEISIEVEIDSLAMVQEAIQARADMIRLDNMTVPMVRRAVALIDGKAYAEASGGITLDTIVAYAETGVNGISIPALTDSVPSLAISLRF